MVNGRYGGKTPVKRMDRSRVRVVHCRTMVKKIALFVLGLALMLGAFLLYQYVSGPDALGGKGKGAVRTAPTTLPVTIEQRNEKGELDYVITATSAPTPMRDANGNPLPGQFGLDKPLATFYDRAGGGRTRIIQISADTGTAVIERGPKGGSGGLGELIGPNSGKLADTLSVREGKLMGHVRMLISEQGAPAPAATRPGDKPSADALAGGLRVYFDGDLHLDGIQEVLTTKDGIHLRGSTIAFDAKGMQLVFNRKAQRVEFLGIDNGNQVIVRGVGQGMLARIGSATQPATRAGTGPAGAPATALAAATAPATQPKDVITPTTYRLSFGQDVRTAVGQGASASALTSEHLYLIFTASRELFGDTSTTTATTTATATATSTAPAAPGGVLAAAAPAGPTVLQMPENPEPIAPAAADDLTVTWTGPMEMRPSDENDVKLVDGRDVALEAVGTALKPVTVTDARFGAQAGRLLYHRAEQKIVLEPRDFNKVLLTDPARGGVECAAVTIDQLTRRAVLTGPGTLVSRGNGGATTATWTTHLDLDLDSSPDPKDPKKMLLAVRRAVLYGAGVKADTFDLKADVLDVLIANVIDKARQTQALEHLLATGNVVVHSYKKVAATAGEQGGMQTQRMEILTARTDGSQVPVPSEMRADGDVVAWRFTDKTKTLGAAMTGLDPAQGLQKETLITPKLVASLSPKAKPATGPATAATVPATMPENVFAGIGQGFDVTRFLAANGARVEILPPPADAKNRLIVATASTIDAYPLKGTATLTAADGAPDVQIALGGDTVLGRTVDLDSTARTFAVAGAGVSKFILPPDKTRKVATPMVITWQDALAYDDLKHLVVFTGQPVARMLAAAGAPDQSDQARLACARTLTVQLKPAPVVPTPSSAAPATAAASAPASLGGTNLVLDWMQADGQVEALGAQLGPDDKLLTRLRLSVPDTADKLGSLRYGDSDRAFNVDGPGFLVVENLRPDKAGDPVSNSGEYDFAWMGGLKYDAAAGTVTFTRDVFFFFKPVKPFKFGTNIAGGNAPATATAKRPMDIVRLSTDQLVATLTKPKDSAGKTIESPIGLGAGGNQEVSKVVATGSSQFDVGYRTTLGGIDDRNLAYHIAGDALTFDAPTNIVTMSGKGDEPAVIQQPGTGWRASGQQIKLDMTKDKNFIEVKGFQGGGQITNFGG